MPHEPTIEPLPCPVNAAALVTEQCVRTTLTGRTSALDGAGTRLCQFTDFLRGNAHLFV
jgi:hypothetical protein